MDSLSRDYLARLCQVIVAPTEHLIYLSFFQDYLKTVYLNFLWYFKTLRIQKDKKSYLLGDHGDMQKRNGMVSGEKRYSDTTIYDVYKQPNNQRQRYGIRCPIHLSTSSFLLFTAY